MFISCHFSWERKHLLITIAIKLNADLNCLGQVMFSCHPERVNIYYWPHGRCWTQCLMGIISSLNYKMKLTDVVKIWTERKAQNKNVEFILSLLLAPPSLSSLPPHASLGLPLELHVCVPGLPQTLLMHLPTHIYMHLPTHRWGHYANVFSFLFNRITGIFSYLFPSNFLLL